MSKHGCSLITFYQKCREYDTTVMLIEASDGYKFGAFCLESWSSRSCFFGNGEQIIFTFKDTNDCISYSWQGTGDQHMWADDR